MTGDQPLTTDHRPLATVLSPAPIFFLLFLTGGWLVPPLAIGLTGDLTNDPANVIKKYLSLDHRGARLTAASYESVRPYVAWDEEPTWKHFVVIQEFSVNDDVTQWDIVSSTEAVIPVTFQVLGIVDWETATFVPKPREEVHAVRIRAVDNRWRMIEPMFPPHVGHKRVINFVKDVALHERDETRIRVLDTLRGDVEKAGHP